MVPHCHIGNEIVLSLQPDCFRCLSEHNQLSCCSGGLVVRNVLIAVGFQFRSLVKKCAGVVILLDYGLKLHIQKFILISI